ncbi:MAG TPA: hypothetical protein VGH37_16060 [Candidatus Acidoferrum sp.]|jgi:hypothetical protein
MKTISLGCTRPPVSSQIISSPSAESRARSARKWLLATAAILVLTLFSSGLTSAQTDLFVGTWKLNVAKSTPARKSETRIVESSPTGLKVSVDRTNADGSNQQYSYTTNLDGKSYPITGSAPYGADSIAVTLGASNTLTYKLTKGGKVVGTGKSVVSADGKTLTLTSQGTDASGKTVSSVSVYDKQ